MSLFNFFSQPKSKEKTVLVIDDSRVDREVVNGILTKQGYQVLLAENGSEGLRVAREQKPDLIILDFHMPDLKGPAVGALLKSEDGTRSIPIIFLTSDDTSSGILDSFEYGADNYLHKPVSARELVLEVDQIIKEFAEKV